ncbi:MAG: signal peptide peptidase SppA [Gammaproteobacteria bacterium]|jgi:protease IV|nr:signal peptide peptidase SppA [Gammaproteobacteria bacterium]MBT4461922.1 signal peptide peptidase SppA [Gammaproteobacteria bacterium]MBT4654311.1 signal peptide peptidase SppA [Gammaproteobacteria bacterium]MBT5116906.1 signal peptide peptidase SppA [Gammaproteobacteria bacterium]MBT5761216.1 signal peptide peptidase SppA [Gammaproteobacteria bacterium]
MEDNNLTKILVDSLVKERESERKFKFIRRVIVFVLFILILISILMASSDINYSKEHVALININGEISATGPVNVESVIPYIKKAINNDYCLGVVLKINSPGGSATQSKIIFDEINKLKKINDKKVYAVIEDVGASGGYYIAASGEMIFANASSIVGSIGVRLDSFNLSSLMKKLGIEAQVISSGEDKTMLDPFNKLSEKHKLHLESLLSSIHNQFISDIKKSRASKINENNVFTGLFWTGTEALKIGLVDEIASIYDVNEKYFDTAELITYNKKDNLLNELMNANFKISLENSIHGIKY